MDAGQAYSVPVETAPPALPSHFAALLRVLHEPAMFVRASDRVILDVNKGCERLFGRTRASLVGASARVVHVDETLYVEFGQRVRDATAQGASFSLEWSFQAADGRRFLAEVGIAPAYDHDGSLCGYVGTIRDLTQQRMEQARAALLGEASALLAQRSLDPEAILRSLARLATRHVSDYCSVDLFQPDGSLRRVEVAHADPSLEDALRSYQREFPPTHEYAERMRMLPRGGSATFNGLTIEAIRAFLRDERHVLALQRFGLRHALNVPLYGRDGILGILAFSRSRSEPFNVEDETLARELCDRAAAAYENAHLHARVMDGEAKWRSLVEHASDWVYLADAEGRIEFINRAREGTTVEQILGRRLYDWLAPDQAERVRAVYEQVFRTGRPGVVTTTAHLRGRDEHYEMRIGPVLREGRVVAATVTTIDVTARMEQEREITVLHTVQKQLAQDLDVERVAQAATEAARTVSGAAFGAFLAATLDGPEVVRSDDITTDPRYGKTVPHQGLPMGHLAVRSYLAVPVVSRTGTVHGELVFGHPEPRRFNARAEELVLGIAAQAAIALDNAHLYRRAKENEERLREREAQLAQAQRIAHLGSWTSDVHTGKLQWSDENYRIHGIPVGEPVTMERMLAIVHPEDLPRVRAAAQRALERGEAAEEYRLVMPDGTVKHVQARGRVERDAEGQPVRGVGVTLDISERKAAEHALRESERRFRTLVTATTHMVWSTDREGMVADMPEWREFTGQSVEEVRGAGWLAAVHAEDVDRVRSAWVEAFGQRRVYECEYRVRSRAGEYRWFLARGVPRLTEKQELIEYIGTWTDITKQRETLSEAEALRLQLAQSEKLSALGSLVGGVAHEIRTPLTYLANNLALVELAIGRVLTELPEDKAAELRSRLQERLLDAGESITRIDRIVGDLRRYTKLRAHTERVRASLSTLVADALHLFRATHKGEVIVLEELRSARNVLADRVQIQQVLLNLLQNAHEAKPLDARIRVRTYDSDQGAVLEVEDRGEGIAPHVLQRMWDPFFTTKVEGSGLGLSVVKRILDAHAATIEVTSRPGSGTTFKIVVPHNDG